MPYSLITNITNFDALLGNIRDFLVATGDWTINQDLITPDEGTASAGRQLVATNGDCLVGLRSTTTGAGANRLYLFDGVPPFTGSPSLDQLNNNSGVRYSDSVINGAAEPSARHIQQRAGPFPSAHLLSNDPSTYCHVVVEITAGVYKHLLFGNMTKFGTWTGGAYYACTYWSELTSPARIDNPIDTTHSHPFDNATPFSQFSWTAHYVQGSDLWIAQIEAVFNSVQRRQAQGSLRSGFGNALRSIGSSNFSGLVPFARQMIGARTLSDTPDTLRFIGEVPDVRGLNIQNLIPGTQYAIGSDNWLVFPLVAKNGGVLQFNSGVYGTAYLIRS